MTNFASNNLGALRLVVADPYPLLVAGIKAALAGTDRFEVVGEAESASDVPALVMVADADVVLLDIGLASLDDFSCLRQLKKACPGTKVVILASAPRASELREVFSEGASALILKTIEPADLAEAIERAATATVFIPLGPIPVHAGAIAQAGLTVREAEVLHALSDGFSNREIAQTLTISERTVKYHLSNIYRKLRVRGRADAVRWTFERGVRAGR